MTIIKPLFIDDLLYAQHSARLCILPPFVSTAKLEISNIVLSLHMRKLNFRELLQDQIAYKC